MLPGVPLAYRARLKTALTSLELTRKASMKVKI
jgi:hypothetical protein